MPETICRDVYRGETLALQVLDREGARQCAHQEPYAVVSITDPEYHHPKLHGGGMCRGVLQLTFSDVDERVARMRAASSHIAAFTLAMARQVVRFVREQREQGTGLIVVHCEAGMSRSAGIASALSRFYNFDETFFLVHYRPNRWVRKLMIEALEGETVNSI